MSERRGGTSNRWAILLLAGAIALLPAFLPNSFYFDLAIKATAGREVEGAIHCIVDPWK